jgi:hypothetical protein
MQMWRCIDGRIRGTLRFHGAQTYVGAAPDRSRRISSVRINNDHGRKVQRDLEWRHRSDP